MNTLNPTPGTPHSCERLLWNKQLRPETKGKLKSNMVLIEAKNKELQCGQRIKRPIQVLH